LGVLYVENRHADAIFTHAQLRVLRMLVMQAALSIENARLYNSVTIWGTQLQQKNEELEVEIKERHQAETSMRTAKEAAEKANAAKSAFVANLSHEIR
jgi:two-component system NarL family sensor kinase